MRWHKDRRIEDGVLRHPANFEAWKDFDRQHKSFALDSRNVRLGLSSDGFNLFANMSTNYSIWPIFLVLYNLPPWKCMKDPFFMMSLLILGPKSLGKNIPLTKQLKELWEVGVATYDVESRQIFCLYASLLCTISDLPTYRDLSGWSAKENWLVLHVIKIHVISGCQMGRKQSTSVIIGFFHKVIDGAKIWSLMVWLRRC